MTVRSPGPILRQGGAQFKVFRGSTSVNHVAAGIVTTNVDVTGLGLPAITRTCEWLTGFVVTAGTPNTMQARIRRTSATNLEVVSQSSLAGAATIKVDYLFIYHPEAVVQRGVTSLTLSAVTGYASSSVVITDVKSLANAVEIYNGCTNPTTNPLPTLGSVNLTDTTHILVEGYNVNAGQADVNWAVMTLPK